MAPPPHRCFQVSQRWSHFVPDLSEEVSKRDLVLEKKKVN